MDLKKYSEYREQFSSRHIGPNVSEEHTMLKHLGLKSLDDIVELTVPQKIRLSKKMPLPEGLSEVQALAKIKSYASKNQIKKSLIGMGYSNTVLPNAIKRNVLENPGWYTQYTPYQPEISQGRLESLLNFQTMISSLTALPVANASLLDEGTAAAEAMALCHSQNNRKNDKYFLVSEDTHPQTIEVIKGRAEAASIKVKVGNIHQYGWDKTVFAVLISYPSSEGGVEDYKELIAKYHDDGAMVVLATDLLALTMLTPPGELGADIAVGSSQRFGVPLGFGGPHAAFFATKDEFKRKVPGRIVGVSKDKEGNNAYRLALQTREQHIRREKATSNICTAQALLANIAAMYAVYHGPEGLKNIAGRVHALTCKLADGLGKLGYSLKHKFYFDTLTVLCDQKTKKSLIAEALKTGYNLRDFKSADQLGLALDETTTEEDVDTLLAVFAKQKDKNTPVLDWKQISSSLVKGLLRTSSFLEHAIFNSYHTETELMRYITKLESRDLSLTSSMIPLGSCTMKLNAASELEPISWPEFANIHPFAPHEQWLGYKELCDELAEQLAICTGYDAVSLQPNSGAQGELAGLMTIKAYHESRGEGHRNICLIPVSAHGTNPASAQMCGYNVVSVKCDENGNIDAHDLQEKARTHKDHLAGIMVTYPSTHGVFEENITEVCDLIHQNGGQVYLDGANLNAQVGLCAPGFYGSDVSHLNLHKTFCIPHGGGGPGVGPIGVKSHLAPFLPGHPQFASVGGDKAIAPVSAAPYGSAGILPISWMYIAMMGAEGLTRATKMAILNANYIAKKLEEHYPVLYKGKNGFVAHECIIDLKGFKTAGIEVADIAKRLMDYGFHSPTMAFPVRDTLMIEPTESESLAEMDRFCRAMISIREEIAKVEKGTWDKQNNPLKLAPHTASQVTAESWDRGYSRQVAAFPTQETRDRKFWPHVARIDEAFGDRNFICSCPPMEEMDA